MRRKKTYRQMTRDEFINVLLLTLTTDSLIDEKIRESVRVLRKGYTSDDPFEKNLIQDTNATYFNQTNNEELLDDFVVVEAYDTLIRGQIVYLQHDYEAGGKKEILRWLHDNLELIRTRNRDANDDTANIIANYERCRDRLIIRPLNLKANVARLANGVYWECGDIALALYYLYADDENGVSSVMIPRVLTSGWAVSLNELWDTAIANTQKRYPERFLSPTRFGLSVADGDHISDPVYADAVVDVAEKDRSLELTTFLSTNRQVNGAAALFYPGVMEKAAEMMGGDYFVSFIGTSLVAMHPAGATTEASVKTTLMENNDHFAQDVLSWEVYRYSAATGVLSITK